MKFLNQSTGFNHILAQFTSAAADYLWLCDLCVNQSTELGSGDNRWLFTVPTVRTTLSLLRHALRHQTYFVALGWLRPLPSQSCGCFSRLFSSTADGVSFRASFSLCVLCVVMFKPQCSSLTTSNECEVSAKGFAGSCCNNVTAMKGVPTDTF